MKASNILFGLFLAAQALPSMAQSTAPQTVGERTAESDDHYEPLILQLRYKTALTKLQRKLPAFSYDEVQDRTRFLANGDQVKTQTTATYVRDQQGRMRITYQNPAGAQRIAIVDPGAQVAYLVRPDRKDILRLTGDALERAPYTSKPVVRDERIKNVHTDLGVKVIAGVNATGAAIETTKPAGVDGNEKDLVETSEMWMSRELGEVIYMRITTPQYESIRHVENVKFVDAPAADFAIPDGYAIRDVVIEKTVAQQ